MDDGDAACALLDQARGDDEDCLTEDEEDDTGGIDPFLNGYEGWLAQWKAGQHVRANVGGSRPLPENTVDEVAFAIAVWDGAREEQLLHDFGMSSVDAVKRLKRRLGLTFLRTGGVRPVLPSVEELCATWAAQPQLRTVDLAIRLRVSLRRLQLHFVAVDFRPKPLPDDGPVKEALTALMGRGWCSNLGVTFAASGLKSHHGIYASAHQIRRCLLALDPQGVRRRAKEAAKTKFVYSVPGPRSLYHIDAHEKLAKVWGMWLHICVDGYSRYIVYLAVSTDKYAATVRAIFLKAMNQPHPADPAKRMWASRIRGDKGSENAGWVEEQILRMGPGRGSALLGRSVQNCRAEYMWARVRRHVTDYFRALFFEMQAQGQLNPNSPSDLHCLQAVFARQVQEACDDFCTMWNNHVIRGKRTVAGHGGGIPAELFLDPVRSETVLDDDAYNADPESYGVDEPIRADDDAEELSFSSKHVLDPLDGFPALLAVRTKYFEREPLAPASDGVDDYLRYRFVCLELLAALSFVRDDDEIDWACFSGSVSAYEESTKLNLRHKLGWLGWRAAASAQDGAA